MGAATAVRDVIREAWLLSEVLGIGLLATVLFALGLLEARFEDAGEAAFGLSFG